MKKNTRKSTALISLVLVPMNLLGLGFTGGCDSREDSAPGSFSQSATPAETDEGEVIDFDARDPDDVFNLDPVSNFAGGPPATQPTTQPLASSGFASQTPHHSGTYTHYRSGGGFMFVPIPFRTGYRPPYRGAYRPYYRPSPSYGSSGYSGGSSGSSSYSRSSPSRSSSGSSHSSSVSRGGFGSSGHASSSSGS
jgi:hypothetical protein